MSIDEEVEPDLPPTTSGSPENQPPPQSPWVAVLVILVGNYAAVLNITVVGVALPSIDEAFGAGALSVDWVVTIFLTGVVLVLPLTGWLADRLGRRVLYIFSLVAFGAGAGLCAVAPNMLVLVAGRLLQGFGGGALMPVGMAMVYDLFPPHRRGTAMGIWGIGIMAAPAAGPPLGGWMVSTVGWRWIFGVFVVVSVLAVALAVRWLPDVGHQERRRLDPIGWVLLAVGVVLIVLGSRQGTEWGWDSPITWAVMGVAVACLVGVVFWARRRSDPIIDLDMFGVPTFAMAMIVIALMSIGQFARLTFLPIELQVVRELDAQRVGLLLAPGAIGVAMTMPIAGWLADRVGSKLPATVGLAITTAMMWQLAHLSPDVTQRRIVEILLVQGIGMGLVFMPTTLAAMNSLPSRFVAQAAAVNNLVRQLGGALGVAVLSAVIVASVGDVSPVGLPVEETQAAYNRVFVVASWFFLFATVVAAVFLPGRRQSLQHQRDRAEESVAVGSTRE